MFKPREIALRVIQAKVLIALRFPVALQRGPNRSLDVLFAPQPREHGCLARNVFCDGIIVSTGYAYVVLPGAFPLV